MLSPSSPEGRTVIRAQSIEYAGSEAEMPGEAGALLDTLTGVLVNPG